MTIWYKLISRVRHHPIASQWAWTVVCFIVVNVFYWLPRPVVLQIEADTKWLAGQFANPDGIAFDFEQNRVFIANHESDKVYIIDLAKGILQRIISLTKNDSAGEQASKKEQPSNVIYVSSEKRLFVQCKTSVIVVDLESDQKPPPPRKVVPQPGEHCIITGMWTSLDKHRLFIACQTSKYNKLFYLDVTSDKCSCREIFSRNPRTQVDEQTLLSRKKGLRARDDLYSSRGFFQTTGSCSENWVIVPNVFEDTITVLDLHTIENDSKSLSLIEVRAGKQPCHVAFDRVNQKIFVANFNEPKLAVIDAHSADSISRGPKWVDLAESNGADIVVCTDSGEYVLATSYDSSKIHLFESKTPQGVPTLLGMIEIFNGQGWLTRLALSDATRCFVLQFFHNQIVDFDVFSAAVALHNLSSQFWYNRILSSEIFRTTLLGGVIVVLALIVKREYPIALLQFQSHLQSGAHLPKPFTPLFDFCYSVVARFASQEDVLDAWLQANGSYVSTVYNATEDCSNVTSTDRQVLSRLSSAKRSVIATIADKEPEQKAFNLASWINRDFCSPSNSRLGFVALVLDQDYLQPRGNSFNDCIVLMAQTKLSAVLSTGTRVELFLVKQLLRQGRVVLILPEGSGLMEYLKNPPPDLQASVILVSRTDSEKNHWTEMYATR